MPTPMGILFDEFESFLLRNYNDKGTVSKETLIIPHTSPSLWNFHGLFHVLNFANAIILRASTVLPCSIIFAL